MFAGTATISYTIGTGCSATIIVNVISLPAMITGPTDLCEGSTATFSDATPGGTWSSDFSYIAGIGSSSGFVTGVSAGMTTISYSLGTGCSVSAILVVNPVPAPITGNTNICVSATTTLADITAGGTWSSSSTVIASVDGIGDVTGVSVGKTVISYILGTGCSATITVTVNAFPTAIIGTENVCLGSSYTFSDGVPGGTWMSTNPGVATAGSISGVVTGIALGSATIRYTTGPGCSQTLPINVVPLPTIFTVTGGGNYCAGGPGVHIGLNGSVTGTNYFLYIAGVIATGPLAGTGSALDFGLQTVGGTYSARAVNAGTGCSVEMSGTAVIIEIGRAHV